MKLKKFKNEVVRQQSPAISITKKSGAFCINKAAVEKTELKPGDKLEFFQDETDPLNWYFSIGEDGMKLRPGSKSSNSLNFNSRKLCEELIKSLNIKDEDRHIKIGAPIRMEGKTYWPVLYSKY